MSLAVPRGVESANAVRIRSTFQATQSRGYEELAPTTLERSDRGRVDVARNQWIRQKGEDRQRRAGWVNISARFPVAAAALPATRARVRARAQTYH